MSPKRRSAKPASHNRPIQTQLHILLSQQSSPPNAVKEHEGRQRADKKRTIKVSIRGIISTKLRYNAGSTSGDTPLLPAIAPGPRNDAMTTLSALPPAPKRRLLQSSLQTPNSSIQSRCKLPPALRFSAHLSALAGIQARHE